MALCYFSCDEDTPEPDNLVMDTLLVVDTVYVYDTVVVIDNGLAFDTLHFNTFTDQLIYEVTSYLCNDSAWSVESSSEHVSVDISSGVGDTTILVNVAVEAYNTGEHYEQLLLKTNEGIYSVAIVITQYNPSGRWEGNYSWECTETLKGEMDIAFDIEVNPTSDTLVAWFGGMVYLNGDSTDIAVGYLEYPTNEGVPAGHISLSLEYYETDSFVNNHFTGLVDIYNLQMEGTMLNGDSPAFEGTDGCSANEGESGYASLVYTQ